MPVVTANHPICMSTAWCQAHCYALLGLKGKARWFAHEIHIYFGNDYKLWNFINYFSSNYVRDDISAWHISNNP